MTIWFLAWGMGLTALLLMTSSTCLGALMTGRGRPATRVIWQYLHRVTASLGLLALAIHITAILADSYAGVGWRGALIPFTSGYRPQWVALGTLAAYTFLLVAAIGFARARFTASARGAASWRWLHGLAYAGFGAAMWHGWTSGTDTSRSWVQAIYLGCGLAVLASIALRLTRAGRPGLLRHGRTTHQPLGTATAAATSVPATSGSLR